MLPWHVRPFANRDGPLAGRAAGEPDRALRRGRAAAARRRRVARALPDRLPDLRHAQRRQVQRRADLPCADRRPARRQRQSGHRQAGLVALMVGPGQADRHRPLLRHLRQRARRLHGHDRPGLDQPGDRQALRPRLSRHHHPRHGAGAGDADRPARHRDAALRDRRLDGRHAGAAMGGELSRNASSPPCRSPARRATRRRTSPSTRSAARR